MIQELSWHPVVEAGKVTEGAPHGAKFGDLAVGIFELEGEFYAVGNVCTHAFALLTNGFQEGCLVECPLHAGFFDIRSGKAQGGIVEVDLPTYPVKVEDGWIHIQLP